MNSDKLTNLEVRLERLERFIEDNNIKSVDELFGGRIGKVNSSNKKEGSTLAAFLNKKYKLGGNEWNVVEHKRKLYISCSFHANHADYNISVIDSDDASKKIYVALYKKGSNQPLATSKGLIFNPDKILTAIKDLIKKNSLTPEENKQAAPIKKDTKQDNKKQDTVKSKSNKSDDDWFTKRIDNYSTAWI